MCAKVKFTLIVFIYIIIDYLFSEGEEYNLIY